MLKAWLGIMTSVLLAGCNMVGIRHSAEPDYRVARSDGDIEIRLYDGIVIAETVIEGNYSESGSIGFNRLAGYIFGNNRKKEKMAMTTPVYREAVNEKIAMTAPVLQQAEGHGWRMAFVMPAGYTLDSLPEPMDGHVVLKTVPARKVAVIRYSGSLTEARIAEKTRELETWLSAQPYKVLSPARSAAYDPPWTVPALRRNEVHIDIE